MNVNVLEAFPGQLSEKARDVSDDLLRPEDRFTAAERECPRMSWLNQSAERDRAPEPRDADGSSGPGASHRRLARKQGRVVLASRGDQLSQFDRLELAADLVSNYIATNSLPSAELPALITQVHAALTSLSVRQAPQEEEIEKVSSAQIKRSITPDALISFIDGKPYKMLKRHLTTHGLDIEEYRRRYGLPADYPAVSANYSAARSALAKDLGLGQQRRKPSPRATDEEAVSETPAPRKVAGGGRKTGGRGKAAA